MPLPPEEEKLEVTLGVRLTESDDARAKVLAKHAGLRSVSDYLRPVILRFLDAEQARLGVDKRQIDADFDELRRRKQKASRPRKRGNEG